MLKIQKWLVISLLITTVSYADVCVASKVDAVVNVIKKSVGKVDDVSSAAGKASIAHIDDVAKHPAPSVNKNTAVQNIGEDTSFWQTYAGTQVIRRLGECVANKMKIYPSYSQAQALAVCKQSYSTCKSNKNSVSSDDQCVAEVNKPQSFVLKPKYDYLGPTLDVNSLKNQQ